MLHILQVRNLSCSYTGISRKTDQQENDTYTENLLYLHNQCIFYSTYKYKHLFLDVINTVQWTNIVTVEDNLTIELIPVELYLIVLDHYHDKINPSEELVEVMILARDYILLNEWIINL